MDKERFYCVCCGSTMESLEAEVVFLTGFYKVIHPLGCCKVCYKQSQAELPQQDDVNSEVCTGLDLADDLNFTMPYNPEQQYIFS